jgi:hypothetical protein
MKTLKESDILRIMRQEWDERTSFLNEEENEERKRKHKKKPEHVELEATIEKQKKIVISPELRVEKKNGRDKGVKYTIDHVNPYKITLREPEGSEIAVDVEDLEKNYEIA